MNKHDVARLQLPAIKECTPRRREGDRDGRRRHHVLRAERGLAAVEVAHPAAADVDRADGESRRARSEEVEVDERAQRVGERPGRVVRRRLDADLRVRSDPGGGIGRKEPGDAARETPATPVR
mgnify:CR=1 FL=1